MPLSAGETTSGSAAVVFTARASAAIAARFVSPSTTRRVDDVEQPLLFPVRQVPPHRDGDGADLPRGQRGDDEFDRVGNRQCDHRTLGRSGLTAGRVPTGWPRAPGRPGQCGLGTVLGDDGERGTVRVGRGAHGQLGAVRHSIVGDSVSGRHGWVLGFNE